MKQRTIIATDAVADWHADKALFYYRIGKYARYRRHIHIADERRAACGQRMATRLDQLQHAFSHRR